MEARVTQKEGPLASELSVQVTRATLGMHELYLREQGGDSFLDKEGLVPVIMTELPALPFANWAEADAKLAELERRLPELGPGLHHDYLGEMLDSLRALVVTFRGEPMDYREKIRRFLRVSP